MRLHLGAFDQVFDGWVNTDITPHIWLARIPFASTLARSLGLISELRYRQHRSGIFRRLRYVDISRRFPFTDNSIDAIFASHLLEHIPRKDALHCLTECHRVLKPGALIRLAIPDLDALIRDYDPADPDSFVLLALEPQERRTKNRHHYLYNETSLARLLQSCGFQHIRRAGFRQGACPDVERIDCRPESLFMEATKPDPPPSS
jgi:SAM-dependent methyltransferase